MFDLAEVAVGGGVEEGIGRQVDVVDPVGRAGAGATQVAHGVVEAQQLAGFHPLGHHHGGHAQVGGRAQRDVDRPHRGVVAFVAELGHAVFGEPNFTDLHRRGTAHATEALDVGIGEGDQVERTVGIARQREGGRALVAGAGRQVAVAQELTDQQVVAVQGRITGQEQAVIPERFAGIPTAQVGHGEADAHRLARAQLTRRYHQLRHLQVGLAVGDCDAAAGHVIGLRGVLINADAIVGIRPGVEVAALLGVQVGAVGRRVVGDDIDEVVTADAGRQRHLGGIAVAGARRHAPGVVVRLAAHQRGPAGYEHRVGREVDVVHPDARAGPHRRAIVAHGPVDGCLLTREVLGRRSDGHHLQVGRAGDHLTGHGAAVVVFFRLPQRRQDQHIGAHRHVAAIDGRRQVEVFRQRVGTQRFQLGAALEDAQIPHLRARRHDVGHVGDQHLVVPVAGSGALAQVAHRPGDAERRVHRARRRQAAVAGDVGHLHIGQRWDRRAQDVDRPGLVVVVVELVRVVRVQVAGQRVFEHRVVGVGPGRDVEDARGDLLRDAHLDDLVVALAHCQRAGVADAAQQDALVATRVGPGLVGGEPDRVGPAAAVGDVRASVGDGVAHLDLAAIHRLGGRHHGAGHQVGQWLGLDVDGPGDQVVGLVGRRVLVNVVAGIGQHQEVARAAEALRDDHAAGGRGVGLARRQRGAVLDRADEDVVGTGLVVQRQVDVVAPAAIGWHRATVDDDEADRRGGAGLHPVRRHDGLHLQVGPGQQRQHDRRVVAGAVVGFGAAFVDRVADIGADRHPPAAFDLGRQAEALGAGVAQPGAQAGAVVERAQRDRLAARHKAVQGDQVTPAASGRGLAVVGHRPGDFDRAAFIGCVGRGDVGHHQVG